MANAASPEVQMGIVVELDKATQAYDKTRALTVPGFAENTISYNRTKLAHIEEWHSSLLRIAEIAQVPTAAYQRDYRR